MTTLVCQCFGEIGGLHFLGEVTDHRPSHHICNSGACGSGKFCVLIGGCNSQIGICLNVGRFNVFVTVGT